MDRVWHINQGLSNVLELKREKNDFHQFVTRIFRDSVAFPRERDVSTPKSVKHGLGDRKRRKATSSAPKQPILRLHESWLRADLATNGAGG
jgi:hypothetical protein